MRIAVYHNLPSGGALRVLEAYLKYQAAHHHIELFLPETANDEFVPLSPYVAKVHRFPMQAVRGKLGNYTQLREVARLGKRAASAIDAGSFDVVLASASIITQSPEILPYVRTPTLYYAPEYYRLVLDKQIVNRSMPERLTWWGLAPRRAWAKRFDRKAIHQATKVFTHSRFAAERLQHFYGINGEVVLLGVDTAQYHPTGVPRQGFVLSVGAVAPVKGHGFVVQALATLPPGQRPALVVVGDRGEYGSQLEREAKEAGVGLTIKQKIPFPEVVESYNQAGVLAAGQYQEPFGLITLEAMACATPVVAVAEGGLKETVTDNQTGLMTPRDPVAFGKAIRRILDDKALALRIGQAGRADVEKRWQWAECAAKVDGLLEATATTKRVRR